MFGFVGNDSVLRWDYLGQQGEADESLKFEVELIEADGKRLLRFFVRGPEAERDIAARAHAGLMKEAVELAEGVISKGTFNAGPYRFSDEILAKLKTLAKDGDAVTVPAGEIAVQSVRSLLDLYEYFRWVKDLTAEKKFALIVSRAKDLEKFKRNSDCCRLCDAIKSFVDSIPLPYMKAVNALTQQSSNCYGKCCQNFPP